MYKVIHHDPCILYLYLYLYIGALWQCVGLYKAQVRQYVLLPHCVSELLYIFIVYDMLYVRVYISYVYLSVL